jgi:hypothetical protein
MAVAKQPWAARDIFERSEHSRIAKHVVNRSGSAIAIHRVFLLQFLYLTVQEDPDYNLVTALNSIGRTWTSFATL